MKAKTSLIITTFLLVGLVFPFLATNVAFGMGPALGCCTTDDIGSQCVDCPEGGACISTGDFCDSQDGLFLKGTCRDQGQGAECGGFVTGSGCCVLEPGRCEEVDSTEACFLGDGGSLGELLVQGLSCSEVPQCTPTRNIPTMSNWGLIALAGIFILVGVWAITRKKAEA